MHEHADRDRTEPPSVVAHLDRDLAEAPESVWRVVECPKEECHIGLVSSGVGRPFRLQHNEDGSHTVVYVERPSPDATA